MRMWSFCAVALMVAACGSKSNEQPATSGTASGSAAVQPPSAALEVFVDDTSVAKLSRDQLAKWPRLDTLVPEDARRLGTWEVIDLRGTSPTTIQRPSASYANMVPAVFPGDGGAPAFGMFDPVELAKKGKPGMRHDGVQEVRIRLSRQDRGGDHQGGMGGTDDPLKLVLTFKTGDGDKQLTGEQIVALPREPQPGQEDTQGWRLSSLLSAAGVKSYKTLMLIDAGGTSLVLEKAALDEKTLVPFVKLNRQGSLRFRLLRKRGQGWQTAGDLRALHTIKVD